MRWVAFGTYDVGRHPRVAVLIEGLAALGDEVIEVNEPLRLDTAGRVAMLRQPWRLPILAGKLLRCWLVLARRARRVRSGSTPDGVLVGYLGHFDVRLARWLFRGTPIVLDHLVSAAGTARDRGLAGSGGLKSRLMIGIDDAALRSADVVVVDTAAHRAALPAAAVGKAVVAPVGATDDWFAHGRARLSSAGLTNDRGDSGPAGGVQTATVVGQRALRVVFVGVFTPLHGTGTVGAALAALVGDDIDVTMVGTGQDYDACRALAAGNARVQWIDWVPGAELPAFVGGHDVSLGIFGTTPKALNVVPTKVYQGAAAACAVITSDTPPQQDALAGAAVFVPPGDADALVAALRRLAQDRAEVARLGAAAHAVATARFTPAAVVAPIRVRVAANERNRSGAPTRTGDLLHGDNRKEA